MSITTRVYRQAADVLAQCQRVLLVSHERPDGDALGSLVALRSMLQRAGIEATAVTFDPVPPRYALLVEACPLPRWPDEIGPDTVGRIDAIVVADTCTYRQMEVFADFLRASPAHKLVVDHHVTRDDLADVYLIDEHSSATCVLLAEWAEAAGWEVTKDAALALFVGMATDTGWFRFANTDARTLRAAARLIETTSLRPDEIYQHLYCSDSAGRIRLLAAMLETLELLADGTVAAVHITRDMLADCGATRADTEDLVNEPHRIGSVNVAALFVEQDDGRVRVSLRSKRDVDVAAVAAAFGGGGHQRAAGARISGALPEVKKRVIEALLRIRSSAGRS